MSHGVCCSHCFCWGAANASVVMKFSPCCRNMHHLEAAGAQLVFFSPLSDDRLPLGLSALYLGGASWNKFAAQLASNKPMLAGVRAFCQSGGLVYAEASGMFYLMRSVSKDGMHAMPMGMWEVLRTMISVPYLACEMILRKQMCMPIFAVTKST